MLQLTNRAVEKVKALLQAEQKDGYGLRVAVQGGGCSGFQLERLALPNRLSGLEGSEPNIGPDWLAFRWQTSYQWQ